ncbi:OmpA family protein [Pseudomaricurvus sp. HS19]|uniref:OmpA family protein n=1 Tax=Pseudomaricurvus sp. HS19 TaxID=2692626 RepID=UPI00136D7209|nr:OmpA family protein [Pseudomaricurvus sp. HS19]MYM64524.1 OmpA family protein [Pseudomaricurvus sp. HS19]
MKQLMIMTALAAALTTGAAQAADNSRHTELKQSATFTTATVAGAVLGGPLGMFIGALGGAWMSEQIEQADKVDTMNEAVVVADVRIGQLEQQLQSSDSLQGQWQQLALRSLDQRVLFETGSDQLTESGREQVTKLALMLKDFPRLQVRLDGYADPRGTDEYNNVLSEHRALAVRDALLAAGIPEQRLQVFSHGADRSTAARGDLEAYSSERRVDVEVRSSSADDGVVVMN